MSQNSMHLAEDGILTIICVGDQDENSAREIREETLRIAKGASSALRVLLDTTRAGRFSPEARQAAVDSLALAGRGKAAVVASSTSLRALGLILTGEARAQRVRVFNSLREAVHWLREPAEEERAARGVRSLLRGLTRVRWLRIKEPWLKEVFDVLGSVAMGDFSKRIALSEHEDELALIEAGINLMADDLEDRERQAKEYEKRLREERNRLARELHDSLSQLLFSMVLHSESAGDLVESDPQLAKTRIESVRAAARQAQEQMRDLLTDLGLGALEGGLTAALNSHVSMFKGREGIDITFSVKGQRPLALNVERQLFRIAQEALNNIAKHSQATAASVALTFHPDWVRLKIEDNGIGFDPSHPKAETAGVGLSNMRQRAEALKGSLAVESAPGRGTRLIVEVPLGVGYG